MQRNLNAESKRPLHCTSSYRSLMIKLTYTVQG